MTSDTRSTSRIGQALLGVGGACMIVTVLFFGWATWFMKGHGASGFENVRVGMSETEVRGILGAPTGKSKDPGVRNTWYFSRQTWCQIQIEFDAIGRVRAVEHDH